MSELLYNPWRDHINAVIGGNSNLSTQDYCDILEYMDIESLKVVNFTDQVKQLNSIIRQLEVALRIKKEEHDCCAEDLLKMKMQSESLARAVMADMGNKREPLTIAQINAIVGDVHGKCGHIPPTPEIIVRAIERAHGIGA